MANGEEEKKVSTIKVKGKIVITNDKGDRVEIPNPELLVVKRK
jgi:hypothetical protein